MDRCFERELRSACGPWLAARPATVVEPGPRVATHARAVAAGPAPAARADDFDFLHGQWIVEHRRRGPGSHAAWQTFTGAHTCAPLEAGTGHLEQMTADARSAATLRLFDARRRRWTVHPIATDPGRLEAPLEGGFENPVGIFVGAAPRGDAAALVRQVWIRARRPRCELGSSTDGGATWRVDEILEFSRVEWPA